MQINVAVFGGGCFWCTEALFKSLKGVISVKSGYAGGNEADANYARVSSGQTGHAECIQIEFDPEKIDYGDLLSVFFNTHDPTTLNQQGADIGTQYRSVIFYTTLEQKTEAENLIKELNEAHAYEKSVVTELEPLTAFYEAEDYHKNYYEEHPEAAYCQIVIAPKLEKLQKRFGELLK
jgi:peptide-methionine (S)-S-oxide reductase